MTDGTPQPGIRHEYTLDNDWQRARERLARLEALADPATIRHLDTIGVAPGWTCLEIGGGGGSITEWLCRRVKPTGRVVAIDINTRFLDALDYPNLSVRQQSCITDPLPAGPFDLVHARALLVHLPEREQLLDRMVAALRPGGWLLTEEPDYVSKIVDPANDSGSNALFQRVRAVQTEALREAGIDPYYGRTLYGGLRRRGLAEVSGNGWMPVTHGGSDPAQFYRLTAEQLRERFLSAGVGTVEFEKYLSLHDDPNFVFIEGTMMAAWGRRPAL
jgi:SAM-dependent methyltransferase